MKSIFDIVQTVTGIAYEAPDDLVDAVIAKESIIWEALDMRINDDLRDFIHGGQAVTPNE